MKRTILATSVGAIVLLVACDGSTSSPEVVDITGEQEDLAQVQEPSGSTSDDEIVGSWQLLPEYGTYQHQLVFSADGRQQTVILGDAANDEWRREAEGRYRLVGGADHEYLLVRGDVLESYDQEGLIRKFRRDG